MRLLTIFILALILQGARAQQGPKDSLVRMFNNFRARHLEEKLYVHFDEDLHLAGETVWFKIYCVDVFQHRYLDLSKVAYVEVLDSENKPVLQTKVELSGGYGTGSLFLPSSIATGNYWVRAYTHWMRNGSPDFYLHHPISIINTLNSSDQRRTNTPESITAQFFPEGGYAVTNLPGKVAFQVTGKSGNGIDFKGSLINEAHDTVARFAPLKFGIGSFTFKPIANEKYWSVIVTKAGVKSVFAFPQSKPDGYSLSVNENAEFLQISIRASNTARQGSGYTYLVVHAHQLVEYAAEIGLPNNEASITIGKDKLQEGISHITLFDGNLQPVAERLYFTLPKTSSKIGVKADQTEYGQRKKVIVELEVSGLENNVDSMGVSLSISRSYASLQGVQSNIQSYLWLTSDLVGRVESPEYYFENGDPNVSQAIDNLMLTHGWRRFKWNDMQSTTRPKPLFLPEYRGHLIQGQVLNQDGKPVSGVLTYLSSPGKGIRIYPSISDSHGGVKYETLNLDGKRKVILQADPGRDSTVKVNLISPYANEFAMLFQTRLKIDRVAETDLRLRSIGMQVNYMFGKESALASSENADTTAFYGRPSETYKLDAYTRFPVMEEVMREYVKGVLVRKRKDKFHFMVLDNVRLGLFNDNPLVMLDGVPIFDVDKIIAYDPLKVTRLEILTKKYFLGPVTFNGILSYRTYAGDMPDFKLDPRNVVINYEGLQQQREFYAPSYEKSTSSRVPDQRSQLLWIPTVWCKPGEKKRIEFYTSDLPGKFNIVAEGISVEGKLGSGMGTFGVKAENP